MEGLPPQCFACPLQDEDLPTECNPHLNCKGPAVVGSETEIKGTYDVDLVSEVVGFNDELSYAEFGDTACRNKGIIEFLREKAEIVK